MAKKKTELDRAIETLELQIKAAEAAFDSVKAEHEARVDGLCRAVDSLRAQQNAKKSRTRKAKPELVTPVDRKTASAGA